MAKHICPDCGSYLSKTGQMGFAGAIRECPVCAPELFPNRNRREP